LIRKIADRTGRASADIDPRSAPASYGLDSLAAVEISGDLEAWLGVPVPPTLAYEYPTVESLARHLAGLETHAIRNDEIGSGPTLPVAIVGMACRFPAAESLEQFWRLLREGFDAVTDMPHGRSASHGSAAAFRHGGFLPSIDRFDEGFFGISPDEAESTDPQQRLLLELAYEAFEDAGLDAGRVRQSATGVFVGVSNNDYLRIQARDRHAKDLFWSTGNALSIVANRISYQLDLRGPSLAIDTACSSSLVAVHLAVRSIQTGECAMAVVGGVNLILSPEVTVNFSEVGALSRSGRCRAFDAAADGMVRGEGAGVIVLKPLARATADGDRIHAVILGSAVNQDGRTNGLAAPNRDAQEAVVREALRSAGLGPQAIQYVEAHGTGTLLGDPIEAKALGAVLASARRSADDMWWIGSVKTNIGHLEAAAGMAGLIKVALALTHHEIPPHLHFREANPYIDFDGLGLRVPSHAMPWPSAQHARAGVSAFGFGGTNAHVILEHAPPRPAKTAGGRPPYLLAVSAHSDAALRDLIDDYRELVTGPQPLDLDDLCYSASVRRTHHASRIAMVVETEAELTRHLDDAAVGRLRGGMARGRAPRVVPRPVFVYSGFTTDRHETGRELRERAEAFGTALDECDAELGSESDCRGPLEVGQRRMFGVQVALTSLYRSFGVTPGAVIGYSMGEVAAAHAAGALSLGGAARVLRERCRLLQRGLGEQSASGAMAIVRLSPSDVADLIAGAHGALGIAAVNSPEQVMVSGDAEALERLLQQLRQRRVAFRRIAVPGAAHSAAIHRLAPELLDAIQDLPSNAPAIPFYSTVIGKRLTDPVSPQYWARNLTEPVLLADAAQAAALDGFADFIEIGPDATLSASLTQVLRHADREGRALATLARGVDEWRSVLNALAGLYVAGHTINWERVIGRRATFVALPSYPWQRARHWSARQPEEPPGNAHPAGPHVLSERIDVAHPEGVTYWRGRLHPSAMPWLHEHRIQGMRVMTSAAFLAAALDTDEAMTGAFPQCVENVEFRRALFLPPAGAVETEIVVVDEDRNAGRSFRFSSRVDGSHDREEWLTHAVARLPSRRGATPAEQPALRRVQAERNEAIAPAEFYAAARTAGIDYGAPFQGLDAIWRTTGGALTRVVAPPVAHANHFGFRFDPALLDACLQVLASTAHHVGDTLALPVAVRRITLYRLPAGTLWSYGQRISTGAAAPTEFEGEVRIFDDEGRIVADVEGFRVRRVDAAGLAGVDGLYEVRWVAADAAARPPMPGPEPWWIVGGSRELSSALAAELAAGDNQARVFDHGGVDLDHDGGSCRGIVYLASGGSPSDGAARMAEEVRAGCGSLLGLMRHVAGRPDPPHLFVVTCGAQAVAEQPCVAVGQAPLWGMTRTLAQEHPGCRATAIDLDPSASVIENARSLANLLTHGNREDQIAIRQRRCYGARLERARPASGAARVRLRSDATYVVTGGLGELGLLVARWLVDHGARHLLLVGRSTLPPRREWRLLAPGRDRDRVQQLLEIEAAGAAVHVMKADVADYQELRAVFDGYAADARPPVRGILHLAGEVHGAPLLDLREDALIADLDPKAVGAWNLHRLVDDAPVDFFVLFSSGSSILGSPFLAGYAAANAFLDALAHARRISGRHALTINWGFWSEAGMAARQLREHGLRSAPPGMRGMDNRQALDMLERVWRCETPQVAVMPMNWREWASRHPGAAASPLLASLTGPVRGRPHSGAWPSASELRAADRTDRASLIAGALGAHVSHVLGCTPDRIDADQPLTTMGIDSLMAVEIRNRIETEWGLTLPMVQMLEGPTLSGLSAHLADQITQPEPPRSVAAAATAGLAVVAHLSDDEVDRLLTSTLRAASLDE
jgi:acyl transferase domain-containing protein/acyl carrier protein